jgi:hypothetical protein
LKEYFKPYFLSGIKKYVERGDVFVIEDIEMFILNSYPENGFICNETNVMFKLGLNKEKCLEKINEADNKYAFSLANLEESLSRSQSSEPFGLFSNLGGINSSDSSSRSRGIDELVLRRFISNPGRLNCINYFNLIYF